MPNASQEIIEFKFKEFHETHFPKKSRGDAFTQYVSRIALSEYPLSDADIASGIVDERHDGGLDTFHIIANRTEAITSETKGLSGLTPPAHAQQGVPFDVIITQSKSKSDGWEERSIWKLREVIEKFLDPKVSLSELRSVPLNENVVKQVDTFRRYQRKLLSLDPVRSFTVYVMSPSSETTITKPMRESAAALRKSISERLPSTTKVVVEILGAEGLERLRTRDSNFSGILKFSQHPVGMAHGKSQAWLGLVTVKDYLAFIHRPKTSVLRDEFFSTNVRDFAGTKNAVNSAIQNSLTTDSSTSFWWMNNGVTILADATSDQTDDKWLLTNPQVVNGLQTSHVMHESAIAGVITRKRLKESILVRVIRERDPRVRESVIIGTNNQTAVNSIQLYANDAFQVQVETYLETQRWYYERRRWQYRNTTTPASRVKTIVEVAQATIAIHLLRPETARGRPRDLLNTASGYASIFGATSPVAFYGKALDVMDAIETYLATPEALAISNDKTNDRYYIAAGSALRLLDAKSIGAYDAMRGITSLAVPDSTLLKEVHTRLYSAAGTITDKKSQDTLFKSRAFREQFLGDILAWNTASPRSWEKKARRP